MKYVGNSVDIINGLLSSQTIAYKLSNKKYVVGYFTAWGAKLKISDTVRQGYNVIALAFYNVDSTSVKLNGDFN